MDVTICEKWRLAFPAPRTDHQRWFWDWVRKSPTQVSKHVAAAYHAYTALEQDHLLKPESVLELFGGAGFQSTIVRGLWNPPSHVIRDSHPEAYAHLWHALGEAPGVRIELADAVTAQIPPYSAELICVDAGDWTIHRIQTTYAPLWEKICAACPRAIVLTDIAGPRAAANRELYAAALGDTPEGCRTYRGYLKSLSRWLGRSGYGVSHVFYHHWSAILVLVAGYTGETEIFDVPARPVGMVVANEWQPGLI